MIALPRDRTLSRGPLRAFWLTLWGLAAGTWVTIRRPGGPRRRLAAAGMVAAAVAGVLRPSLVRPAYLAWDRGARGFSRRATVYTAWVTHMTALPPGEDNLRAARLDEPGRRTSTWEAVHTRRAVPDPSQSAAPGRRPGGSGLQAVARWLRDRGQTRGRWLLVCLGMLRWLQPRDEPPSAPVANDNYTLY